MSENEEIRTHGILETIKNTKKRGIREVSISNASPRVLDRIKSEGHTIRESPQPGKIIVEIKQEPVSEMEPVEKDTP